MSEISDKLDTLLDILIDTNAELHDIRRLRDRAEREINQHGQITQETCEKMARHMKRFHKNTAKLHNGGHLVHQLMQEFVPEGANEGNKEWPPEP